MAFVLILGLTVLTMFQFKKDRWITRTLRIQFKDDPLHEKYNGCYNMTNSDIWAKRVMYENFEVNAAQGKFGYCMDDRKWYLFTGNKTNACDIEEEEKVVYSARTYTFGAQHYLLNVS